jgi:UDP-N-acetylmuramoylalanine-D-glutamate ligase
MLGVIAAATLVMALIQVALVVVGLRVARQVQGLAARVEQEMRPLIASATATAANAARASELALVQVERVDVAVADLTRRLDEAGRLVRGAVLAPARESRALLAGIGAAFGVIRDAQRRRPGDSGPGDDDPLFVG